MRDFLTERHCPPVLSGFHTSAFTMRTISTCNLRKLVVMVLPVKFPEVELNVSYCPQRISFRLEETLWRQHRTVATINDAYLFIACGLEMVTTAGNVPSAPFESG